MRTASKCPRLTSFALAGEPSGTLSGKPAVRAYWRKALSLFPDLHFDLVSVLVGTNSVTFYYKGARGRLVAEVFFTSIQNRKFHERSRTMTSGLCPNPAVNRTRRFMASTWRLSARRAGYLAR